MIARIGERWKGRAALTALLALALAFFASNAHPELASDDRQWLRGEFPAGTDHYRTIPLASLAAVGAVFGESMAAALVVAFLFHAANGLLLYALARRLLRRRAGATVAAAVFLVNPLTLNTLTWPSCLSYVQGTTAALVALLAFWRATGEKGRARLAWGAAALAAYGAGLLCSHEIFFLPAAFVALGWLRRKWRLGLACMVAGTVLAGAVYVTTYRFGQYGIEAARLADVRFLAAYLTAAATAGPTLGAAYLLSFVVKPAAFIAGCLSEPARWLIAPGAVAAAGLLTFRGKADRLVVALGLVFAAAIGPYIVRLYLTPANVHYDPSYMLWGRVFYWPCAVVALGLALAGGRIAQTARGRLALAAAGLVAYASALRLYSPADFVGLEVVTGPAAPTPPPWTPFAGDPTGGLAFLGITAGYALIGGALLALIAARPRSTNAT